ncbi:DUF5690 family protein [Fulvivirga ulvae]|uniref:DUF5690 family protein n=1 Tax=Fulvivirga ulvae TaxID=2904245 RepID=UPI001F3E16C5|nr:DUF5690 family protein [Fulvivirga ulvae]UII35034.1 DUF5690 family protein [Fulvivirga ulvae]
MKLPGKNTRFILQASIAAFGTYFCMYAFRKPFTVASFDGITYLGIDYKILLVIAQVIGYTISKFLGIRIISELKRTSRMKYLLTFILLAELSLLGFASVPAPYNIIFLLLNGLPLGMVWGIVFSYIEGRKSTELLGVILCTSFIVSSGVVKSVGKWLIDDFTVSEFWMPSLTGLIFILPLILFAFALEKLPPPTTEDIFEKSERLPLNHKERALLFKDLFLPITLIIIFYTALTAIRDFRDNFAREIWDALGFEDSASVYSISEIPIAIIVLIILGLVGTVKANKTAFKYYNYILVAGCSCMVLSTVLFQLHILPAVGWMILSGFGMYICYVPFNGLYFDRLIATFKIKGNVGYLIYMVDAFGYLGSMLILLYKNFGHQHLSWLNFFIHAVNLVGVSGIVFTLMSFLFFRSRERITEKTKNLIYEH